jgi:hypothetical protein
LWESSRSLSSRTEFLTWRKRRPLEAYLNPRSLTVEAASKLKSHQIYAANNLPIPRPIGAWDPRHVGAAELAALQAMISQEPRGIVMKPEHGVGGAGVQVFTACRDGRLLHASGDWWSFELLAERMASFGEMVVVQERVVAHPEIAELAGTDHASSLRLVTCLRDDGSVLLLPATLKLPSPETGIDNFGAGNVAIAVDHDGLMEAAALGLDGPSIEHHPVTRLPFAGRPVPYYAEAVEVVRRGQRCFPLLRCWRWEPCPCSWLCPLASLSVRWLASTAAEWTTS